MDLFNGFKDDEVKDSIKNAELLSTVLKSLCVVDKIEEEKVNKNILIQDSDSDKIDDSDTGGSELHLVSVDNNNLDNKDEMYGVRKTVSTTNIQEKFATSFEEEQEQHQKLSKSKKEITT